MSSQRGNVNKSGPPKHQNKHGWKNVYHDTSQQTKKLIATEVSGVCRRCKDAIDWKIKYKKYKPLSQAKTCVTCKEKRVKFAYHTYCTPCSQAANKCAKCGQSKDIVSQPSMSEAQQASEERQFEFELQMLPERKRRTYLRLKEQGKLTPGMALDKMDLDDDDEDSDDDGEEASAQGTTKKHVSFQDNSTSNDAAGLGTAVDMATDGKIDITTAERSVEEDKPDSGDQTVCAGGGDGGPVECGGDGGPVEDRPVQRDSVETDQGLGDGGQACLNSVDVSNLQVCDN